MKTIIGIGGGGGNVIKDLMQKMNNDIAFIAVNSDAESLKSHPAKIKIKLDDFGAQSIKNMMRMADYPNDSIKTFRNILSDSTEVIVIACLGGEAGSRLMPVFVELLNDMKIPCHVLVTLPFEFESDRRHQLAQKSIERVKVYKVKWLKVISNTPYLEKLDKEASLDELFNLINIECHKFVSNIVMAKQ